MKENNGVRIDWKKLVINLASDTGLDPVSLRYVLHRLHAEGVTFLTKTLPMLAKAVLRSLELGFFERPTHFAWKSASLRYFTVWLNRIFDHKGQVLQDVCPYALKSIRQFCEYFYKLSIPFNKKDEEKAEDKMRLVEEEISQEKLDYAFLERVRKNFHTMYPKIANATPPDVFSASRPRFTSGAFSGSSKLRTPQHLFKAQPDSDIGTCDSAHAAFSGFFRAYPSCRTAIKLIKEQRVSEALFVPKDSRGPRNISKEPLLLLKAQMSYFDWLSSRLEFDSNFRINFKNQERNRELARKSSIDKGFATLDLKEASDRVSFNVVSTVFRHCPAIRWFLQNCRSTHTKLPVSGEIIPLRKLSGMGSGLTFPTMALLIQLSILTSVRDATNLSLNEIRGRVYVYGDDVICPNNWVSHAVNGLQAAGLKVNTEKSFTRSHFRESCGGDYYNGVDVSPVRLKLSNSGIKIKRISDLKVSMYLSQDAGLLQLERHCRELVKNGLISTADYYYSLLKRHFGDSFKPVSGDSPVLGIWTENLVIREKLPQHRIVPVPIIDKSRRYCPFKYIARFFNLSSDAEWSGVFGLLARPKALKLKFKLVDEMTLR